MIFTAMFALIGIFAAGVISSIFRGYVLNALWLWFVVSTFDLPELGIANSLGISILISMLTRQYSPIQKDKVSEMWTYAFLSPATALLGGWIIKTWFM